MLFLSPCAATQLFAAEATEVTQKRDRVGYCSVSRDGLIELIAGQSLHKIRLIELRAVICLHRTRLIEPSAG